MAGSRGRAGPCPRATLQPARNRVVRRLTVRGRPLHMVWVVVVGLAVTLQGNCRPSRITFDAAWSRRAANSATRRTFARTTRSSPEPLRRPARASRPVSQAADSCSCSTCARATTVTCSESRRASWEAPSTTLMKRPVKLAASPRAIRSSSQISSDTRPDIIDGMRESRSSAACRQAAILRKRGRLLLLYALCVAPAVPAHETIRRRSRAFLITALTSGLDQKG
jgi:hypothetical protein